MSRSSTTHHIALPGERTLLARVWPGEGVPVVFLHGIFASSEVWTEVCAEPRAGPCVAFDLPGFGGSDLPSAPDVSAYAEDIAAGIDALGLERFELVGHSFGGAVAARLAELLAARVTSLVLLAPAGFGRIALAEAMTVPGIRSVAEAVVRRSLARRQIALTAAAVAAARQATVALVAAGRAPDHGDLHAPRSPPSGEPTTASSGPGTAGTSRPPSRRPTSSSSTAWATTPLQERRDEMLQLLQHRQAPRAAVKRSRRRICGPAAVRLNPSSRDPERFRVRFRASPDVPRAFQETITTCRSSF